MWRSRAIIKENFYVLLVPRFFLNPCCSEKSLWTFFSKTFPFLPKGVGGGRRGGWLGWDSKVAEGREEENANEQVTKKGIKRKMLRKQAKLYFWSLRKVLSHAHCLYLCFFLYLEFYRHSSHSLSLHRLRKNHHMVENLDRYRNLTGRQSRMLHPGSLLPSTRSKTEFQSMCSLH